jgi:hypothetical protein
METQPMNKLLRTLIFVSASAMALNSFAATGIFGSYIGVNANGSGNTFYSLIDFGTDVTDFNGLNLGSFDIIGTDTLQISAFELETFKNGGGDVTGAELQYRVYEQATSPGSFNVVGGGFLANSTFTAANGDSVTGAGDQKWGVNPTATLGDLLAGTTVGKTYNVEVFTRAFTNEGDRFANNGGSNYIASFTVIPEPSSIIMLGLTGLAAGGIALLKRRKRA